MIGPAPPLPSRLPPSLRGVKALVYDVFGTLTDYQTSVARELKEAFQNAESKKRGTSPTAADSVDWVKFGHEWRRGYYAATAETAAGKKPFKTIDETHRDILDELIAKYGIQGLWNEKELVHLNLCWHRLDVWRDVPTGLRLLRKSVLQATLSNGNVSLLIDLCRNGDMTFDTILSGELFGSYKPDPKVYLGAARLLGVKPEETAMVAAHRWDLDAARKCGLKTIYLLRDSEDQGKGYDEEAKQMGFDLVVGSLEDAGKLFEKESSEFGKARM